MVARSLLVLALCVGVAASGCAAATGEMAAQVEPRAADARTQALMAAYVQRLPVGSRVRATLADGRRLRGTLLQATDRAVAILPRTRLPEPAVDVPLDAIVAIEIEAPSNVARNIAIGVASGVGAALGVLAILAAILADD